METNLKKCQKKKKDLCSQGVPALLALPASLKFTKTQEAGWQLIQKIARGVFSFSLLPKSSLKKKKKSGNYQDMNTWKCSAGHRDRLAEMPLLVVTSAGGYVYQQHQQHIRNGQIFT